MRLVPDHHPAPRHAAFCGACLALVCLLGFSPASAQIRVVTYNTVKFGPHPGLATVLQAIGEESRNGFAKPIDVLLLQEQNSPFGDTQEIVDILNGIYGAGKIGRAHV